MIDFNKFAQVWLPTESASINGYGTLAIQYFFGLLAIFASLTPWASWGTNSLDSQPWPFFFSCLYLVIRAKEMTVPVVYVFLVFLVSVGVLAAAFVAADSWFLLARGAIGYLTLPMVLIAFYDFVRRFGFPITVIKWVNYFWLVVGVLELTFPSLVSWMSVGRTTIGRGVTSLAPEPTFFAIYLIFSSWLILVWSNYRPRKDLLYLVIVNILSVFVLAKSVMGVMFLVPLLFVWYLRRFGFNLGLLAFGGTALISLVLLVANLGALAASLESTRIGQILGLIEDGGVQSVIMVDASINVRIEHAILPIHASWNSAFLPNGFTDYHTVREALLSSYSGLFWYAGGGHKIMSWIGAVVFETGFLGVLFVVILFVSCWNHTIGRAAELFVLLGLLVSAIPLAFSIVPMLMATFRYKRSA